MGRGRERGSRRGRGRGRGGGGGGGGERERGRGRREGKGEGEGKGSLREMGGVGIIPYSYMVDMASQSKIRLGNMARPWGILHPR